MKKGIVNSCVDPRLHSVLPGVASLIGVDATYQFRIAGPDGVWSKPELEEERLGNVAGLKRLGGLAQIEAYAFVGHTDCAGHQVSEEDHRSHTCEAAKAMKEELGTSVPVYAILAVRGDSDSDWSLEVLETF